uniref:Nucleoporin 58 n=1 Tax=Cyprinus carpio carpio TaxID=630221 RepID=A0A9J8AAC5_CYPCA
MSGFNFGSSTLGSTGTGGGFSLGAATSAPAAGTSGFAFGGFGNPTSTPATTSTTSTLGFGSSLFAQKPATGISFNTPASGAAASTTGLTLGSLTTSTAASTGFSLGFGKPAASATPFSLTTTTSAAPGTGLTLGSVLTSTAPQTSSTGFSLNLGGAATTSSAPASGFSFGSSLFSNPSLTGLGQSTLGGSLSLGGLVASSVATTSAPALSLGLGGVDFSTSSEKNTDKLSSTRPEDSKALKDENLPGPICQDVDNFQYVYHILSAGCLLKPFSKCKRTSRHSDSSCPSAPELKNADIALCTQKTPPGLQHENTVPSDYFRALVEQFEVQLQQYRQQIEELENHLTTQSSGSHITPQDLSQAMQKLYQTFVALAAQLQGVHENVKVKKNNFLVLHGLMSNIVSNQETGLCCLIILII